MLAKLEQHAQILTAAEATRNRHLLMVLPNVADAKALGRVPHLDALQRTLSRRKKKWADLASSPVTVELPDGALSAWVVRDAAKSMFEQQTALRKAVQSVLAENPRDLGIAVFGDAGERAAAAALAAYVAWANGARLPQRKKKANAAPLQRIRMYGAHDAGGYVRLRARADGNLVCRELTALPPNELMPRAYRDRLRRMAREQGWQRQEYDLPRLRKLGAGAFVAVAQGSPAQDAAIVKLSYRARGARKTVALVGKGICFDTGGHNLKPARYMHGMHEDMNGSAVVLGILQAAAQARLPVNLDCWLAIAENHLSPQAYRQNEVVTALNGTTIEVVHTDAEGRMVLSDTLTLAARDKPDLVIDFATLTGSMHVALGDRYSGVFATSEALATAAIEAGRASGERVSVFPMDDDYDSALESDIADVKQCTLDGNADHILAARLLKRFTGDRPWIHMDLSGSSCKGGLGAIGTDITGFGVGWALALLDTFIAC
ncbi:MAG TPA: leucyl aminopeptidase family protein [Burkholderiales bacterium]